jgi:hypothetical protein
MALVLAELLLANKAQPLLSPSVCSLRRGRRQNQATNKDMNKSNFKKKIKPGDARAHGQSRSVFKLCRWLESPWGGNLLTMFFLIKE